MISVVELQKDKWDKVIWADGTTGGVEYVYTLHFKGDVEAVQEFNADVRPNIKRARTMGGKLQLWVDDLPEMDLPIRVFWDEKKITYLERIVKQPKLYGTKKDRR